MFDWGTNVPLNGSKRLTQTEAFHMPRLYQTLSKKMFCLSQFCCFCLRYNVKLKLLKETTCSDIPVTDIAKAILPEMRFSDISNVYAICVECVICLAEIYAFRKRCIENNESLMGFIEKLQLIELDVVKIKGRVIRSLKCAKLPALTCESVAKFNDAIKNVDEGEFFSRDGLKSESIKEECKSEGFGEDSGRLYDNEATGVNIETDYDRVDVNAFVETKIDTSVRIKQENDPIEQPTEEISETSAFNNVTFKIEPDDTDIQIVSNIGDAKESDDPLGGISVRQKNATSKLYRCPYCWRQFVSELKLTNHFKSIHECQKCRHTFSTAFNLKRHRETIHADVKKYKCDSCNESYGRWHELRTHRCTHVGIHGCKVCGKCFRSPNELRRHSASHKKKILVLGNLKEIVPAS